MLGVLEPCQTSGCLAGFSIRLWICFPFRNKKIVVLNSVVKNLKNRTKLGMNTRSPAGSATKQFSLLENSSLFFINKKVNISVTL